ncbi:MAG: (d)CMP kinase [Spirochaetaceae bacterium]|nr:MAG: (d)CMP kinase [Spirochaetaceae bacterium]
MIVAIDGPAGSGKTTVAQKAAEASGFEYLDSGVLYRGISKAVLDSGKDPEDPAVVVAIAASCRFELAAGKLMLNGKSLKDIYTDQVDRWSAVHSKIVDVRKNVNIQLRRIVANRDFIVMGRDIGTVVFPDAELKIFLDASIEARTARRYRQDRQGHSRLNAEQIRRSIEQRDSIDRHKSFGRLEQALDALYIDTSDLTIDQVCDRVVREILKLTRNQSGE